MLRSEIVRRFTTTPGWTPNTVPYEMGSADCSLYVCKVLNLPSRENTESLVTEGWIYEIPIMSLKRGDMVGRCGVGTSGAAGHIQFFDGWLNTIPTDNHYYCWEQSPAIGPHRSLIDWPVGYYKAYRYKNVVEDMDAPPPPPTRRYVTVVRWTQPPAWNSTLSGIAIRYGRTVGQLMAWNGITNPNLVYPGQRIYVDPK